MRFRSVYFDDINDWYPNQIEEYVLVCNHKDTRLVMVKVNDGIVIISFDLIIPQVTLDYICNKFNLPITKIINVYQQYQHLNEFRIWLDTLVGDSLAIKMDLIIDNVDTHRHQFAINPDGIINNIQTELARINNSVDNFRLANIELLKSFVKLAAPPVGTIKYIESIAFITQTIVDNPIAFDQKEFSEFESIIKLLLANNPKIKYRIFGLLFWSKNQYLKTTPALSTNKIRFMYVWCKIHKRVPMIMEKLRLKLLSHI